MGGRIRKEVYYEHICSKFQTTVTLFIQIKTLSAFQFELDGFIEPYGSGTHTTPATHLRRHVNSSYFILAKFKGEI